MPRSTPAQLGLALLITALAPAGPAGAQPFVDITSQSGLSLPQVGVASNTLEAAVSLADLDGDGDLDLVMTGGNRNVLIFLRGPNGVWSPPVGQPTPPYDGGTATGHVLFDKDGDGDLDLLVLRKGLPVLFENDGAARFTDVTASSLPGTSSWAASAVAGDLDGDGDLDLIIASYIDVVAFPLHRCAPNQILRNDGGRFTDVTAAWGFDARVPGCSFVAGLVDLDDDLDLDVVVVNDFGQFLPGSELWRNDGPGPDGGLRFTDVTAELGLDTPIYGMGVAIGDADANGRLELALTNIGEPLLVELGADGRFADVGAARGVGPRFASEAFQVTWEAELEDFNGDGWPDLLFAGGNLLAAPFIENPQDQANVLLLGTPGGGFEEAPLPLQVGTAASSMFRAMAIRDLDGDGRSDVVMAHLNGRLSAFRNAGGGPAPTRLHLVPSATGPGAAGARVTATCRGVTRIARAMAGRHYGSADDGSLRLTFPPPCDPTGDDVALAVRWPSGYEQAAATTTGAARVLREPAWLTVTGDHVVADFSGAAAVPLEVEITGVGVAVGPVTETAPGRWEAALTVAAMAVERRLDLWADGVALGAHPRPPPPAGEAAARFSVATYPHTLVARRAYEVTVQARDAPGSDHTLALLLDGRSQPLAWTQGGWRATLTTPDAATVMSAQLALDGALAPEVVTLPVAPPLSAERSVVTFQDVAVSEDALPYRALWARASLLDDNGAAVAAREEDVRLVTGSGASLAPDQLYVSSLVVSAHWDHARLTDDELVQLVIAGVAVGGPQRIRHLPAGTPIASLVDGAQSWCAFSERRLLADGQDVATALVFLKDAGGQNAPTVATPTRYLYEGGLTPGPGGAEASSGQLRVSVRAGTIPGIGRLRVGFEEGGPEAVCEITQVAPPALPALSAAKSEVRLASSAEPLQVGISTVVTVVPRSHLGRAVGSGLALTASAIGGALDGDPVFQGMGRYTVAFMADGSAAPTVTVTSGAPPLSVSKTFALAVTGGGDGDAADAGGGADGGDGGDALVVRDAEADAGAEDTGPLPDSAEGADAADTAVAADTGVAADTAVAADTGVAADTTVTPDTGVAADTAVAPDTADTADAADTADTITIADTAVPDPGPSAGPDAGGETRPAAGPRAELRDLGCAGGDVAPTWLLALLSLLGLAVHRRRGRRLPAAALSAQARRPPGS